jgi:hypothetical protein
VANLKNAKTAEAEAKFKRKQGQATEASQATSDYHAAAHATREKTARLRKLREAKEAADAKAKTEKSNVKSAKGK